MKIGDVAKRTGLSVHTIRYYERIGLIPVAAKDGSGQRMYGESIFPWIEFLGRLKTTGMPIKGMLRYARLRADGPATEPERCAMLVTHREAVRERVAELQACLLILDGKIADYSASMKRIEHAKHQHPARQATRKPSRTRQPNPV